MCQKITTQVRLQKYDPILAKSGELYFLLASPVDCYPASHGVCKDTPTSKKSCYPLQPCTKTKGNTLLQARQNLLGSVQLAAILVWLVWCIEQWDQLLYVHPKLRRHQELWIHYVIKTDMSFQGYVCTYTQSTGRQIQDQLQMEFGLEAYFRISQFLKRCSVHLVHGGKEVHGSNGEFKLTASAAARFTQTVFSQYTVLNLSNKMNLTVLPKISGF